MKAAAVGGPLAFQFDFHFRGLAFAIMDLRRGVHREGTNWPFSIPTGPFDLLSGRFGRCRLSSGGFVLVPSERYRRLHVTTAN